MRPEGKGADAHLPGARLEFHLARRFVDYLFRALQAQVDEIGINFRGLIDRAAGVGIAQSQSHWHNLLGVSNNFLICFTWIS
jgi:hypothetical protein